MRGAQAADQPVRVRAQAGDRGDRGFPGLAQLCPEQPRAGGCRAPATDLVEWSGGEETQGAGGNADADPKCTDGHTLGPHGRWSTPRRSRPARVKRSPSAATGAGSGRSPARQHMSRAGLWDDSSVAPVTATDQIRALARALPEVTEKQHHLFKVPVWQVRGRTFLGMGRDETTAVRASRRRPA